MAEAKTPEKAAARPKKAPAKPKPFKRTLSEKETARTPEYQAQVDAALEAVRERGA